MQTANQTPSHKIAAAVLDHLLARIECTPALDDPFGHIYLEEVFPADIYERMLHQLPPHETYDMAADRHYGNGHEHGEAGLAKNMQRSAIGRPAIRTQPEALPKLATFPAPRPETREEHMLARLAARQGSYDLANASPDIVPLKDLSVPELKIEPMEGTPPDNTPQK